MLMIDDEPRGPPMPHDTGPVVAANLQSGPASLPPLPPHPEKAAKKKGANAPKKERKTVPPAATLCSWTFTNPESAIPLKS